MLEPRMSSESKYATSGERALGLLNTCTYLVSSPSMEKDHRNHILPEGLSQTDSEMLDLDRVVSQ